MGALNRKQLISLTGKRALGLTMTGYAVEHKSHIEKTLVLILGTCVCPWPLTPRAKMDNVLYTVGSSC